MNNIAKAIFKVNTANGSGTAFYLKSNNIFVTNYHVVEGCHQVALETDDKQVYEAQVVLVFPADDLAFVSANGNFSQLPELSFADITTIASRDEVFVLGYPFGMPYTETQGIVSAPRQQVRGKNFIQTDAPVNPGNSGGPLVNKTGEIIGITTSKISGADNMGFAIPADVLHEVMDIFKQSQPTTFSMACSGCRHVLTEATEYCDHCGNECDTQPFEEAPISGLAHLVEEGMKRHGISPIGARKGQEYWQFYQGSSLIRIYVFQDSFLCASAPINKLPAGDLLPILSYMLSTKNAPYRLGTNESQIFLAYRMHLSDLRNAHSGQRLMDELLGIAQKADEMDNYLNETYQCPFSETARLN